MSARIAGMIFLGFSGVLVLLLLLEVVSSLVAGVLFAVGLVVFGVASRGFRKRGGSE